MSYDQVQSPPTWQRDDVRRRWFGLLLVGGLGVLAAGVSFIGTKETWSTAKGPPELGVEDSSRVAADPAWDFELPPGPHRAQFQTSCLICHSARLPFGQPVFHREKWTEIVHKMTAVYGAPMAPADETKVVDYLTAVMPPTP